LNKRNFNNIINIKKEKEKKKVGELNYLLVFINNIFFSFISYLLYICNLSSSSLTNSTFTNITSSLYVNTRDGGAVYIQTPNNYSSFTISHCIFIKCRADLGGALYRYSTIYI
jgi:hypothetical protein